MTDRSATTGTTDATLNTGVPTPLLLSEREAAARLGNLSIKSLFNFRRSGQLAFVRIGTRVFYTPENLATFIAARRQGGGA